MIGGFLIVRRAGALWGLPAERVSTIERVVQEGQGGAPGAPASNAPGLELHLAGGGRLTVDAVLTVAGNLRIHPLSGRLRRFLPAGAAGLALLAGEPLVLMAPEGEIPHA